MFANFFKNLIVSSFGTYIEDFTAKDIEIDKWNGCVVKQNCVIKKTALESIFMSLFGAPIQVVRGYIQNLRINVPWSKLLSSPVEINLDEVHIVLKASSTYNADFAKRMLLKAKKFKVSELLEQIRKSQSMSDLTKINKIEENETYMKRLNKIVSENLQLVIKNVHIRFEDSYLSRKDQMLNFGIVLNQLTYSMTNSNFQRTFINIDDKKREQRSYSMLEVQNLAMYWNSNAKENWHKNKDFLNLSATKHIDHSKKYVDNLRKKYQQFQQNLTTNSVFFMQPCDIKIRFRKNLSPHTILDVPKSTTAIEISGLQLTIDEEIYKDVQYLMKFFAWHQRGGQENRHFKFRPPYNVPVRGNALQYLRYAISSTVYYNRKSKREKNLRQKRQLEIVELSELYIMQQMNEYYERQGYQQRLLKTNLTSQETGSSPLNLNFNNSQELQERVVKLDMKLTAEQIVVALKRSEKKSQQMIQDFENNSGWKNWISGTLKGYYKSHISGQSQDQLQIDSLNLQEFDEIIQNYQDESEDEEQHEELMTEPSFQMSSGELNQNVSPNVHDYKTQGFRTKTLSHLTLQIPKIDIGFVSKKQGSYSKYFMQLAISDFAYHSVTNSKESQRLMLIRNLEVIDKLIDKQKFSRALYKRDRIRQNQMALKREQESERVRDLKKKMMARVRFGGEQNSTRTEIDEEANTNINNGLPLILDYEQILSREEEQSPFLVFQFNERTCHKRGEKQTQYRIEFFMNSIQIFYNRLLLSRTQTFINTASIGRTQNASAEADFDSKLQKFKQKTEDKVKNMLKKSEIFVTCNLKGVEVLIPDNTNYDASKYLILQTGNIVVKNGVSNQSTYSLRNKLTNQLIQHNPLLEQEINFEFQDEYSLTIYDATIYYAPNFQQLENFNFIEQQNEFDRFEILKKTDIYFDLQKQTTQIEESKVEQKFMIQAGLNTLQIQLTNKEIKELKHFSDSFTKYHEQISLEVKKELQYLEHINFQQSQLENQLSRMHRRSFDFDNDADGLEINKEQDQMMQTILVNQKSHSNLQDSLKQSLTASNVQSILSAFQPSNQIEQNGSNSIKDKDLGSDEEDEDEFFDAKDTFDQDIIQMLKLDKNFEKVKDTSEFQQETVQNSFVQRKIIFEFWINKLKINVLESANLQKDIIQGLKQKLGNFYVKDQLEFDVKYKGVPFLYFEVGKIGLMHINQRGSSYSALGVQELALINMDNSSVLRKQQSIIFKSQNYDHEDYLIEELSPRNNQEIQDKRGEDFFINTALRQNSSKPLPIFDPEDEDKIQMMEQANQDSDQFLSLTYSEESNDSCKVQLTNCEVGLIDFQMSENLLNKIIQTLLSDFPSSDHISNQQNPFNSKLQKEISSTFALKWEGLDFKLSVKKEVSNFKLQNLLVQKTKSNLEDQTLLEVGELRILQNDQEIFHKSIEAIDEYDKMLQLKITKTFQNDSQLYDEEHLQFMALDLSLIVVILDMRLVNQLIQSIQKVYKLIETFNEQRVKYQLVNKNQIQQSDKISNHLLEVNLNSSYLQIPLKDNKNSLFLKIKDFNYKQNEISSDIKYEEILVFIAKSQFQDTIYSLIQTQNFEFIKQKGLYNIELDQLQITINENYIMFLANLVDNHFEDSFQIYERLQASNPQNIQNNSQQQNQQQNSQQLPSQNQAQNIVDLILTEEQVAEKLTKIKMCQFTQFIFKALYDITEIKAVRLGQFGFEWIFGLGFDDHEDNFVTLFNKGQSQQILQKFEQQQMELNFAENLNKKASLLIQETQNQDNLMNFSKNYEKVRFEIEEINVNILQFIEHENLCNNTITQFNMLKLSQKQKQQKSQTILFLGEGSNSNNKGFEVILDHKSHQECQIGQLLLQITNINTRVISNLCKSIYSCKNILKRGKKRELIKSFMDKNFSKKEKKESQNMKSLKLLIMNWKISIGIVNEKKYFDHEQPSSHITHSLIQMLSSNLKDEFEHDSSEESYSLVIEGTLQIGQFNKKQQHQQNFFITGNFIDLLAENVTVYLDPQSKNISQALLGNVEIVTLVHPFILDYSFIQNQLSEELIHNDISISLIEIELSLRQIFYIKAMLENIVEELAPFNQVLKHFQQNKQKINKKHNELKQINYKDMQQNVQNQQNFSLSIKHFYFVMLKETGDSNPIKEQLSLPMFSFEMKKSKIDLQLQPNSNQLISGSVPFEIYYFNKKLNFYEPLVERTNIEFVIMNSKNKNQDIEIKINKTININFSVALYETLFFFQNTLAEESQQYEASKNFSQNDQSKKVNKDIKLASSQFFIKNSTGEIIMFKTAHQPTFLELQPEELNELDFDILPSETTLNTNSSKFVDKKDDEEVKVFEIDNHSNEQLKFEDKELDLDQYQQSQKLSQKQYKTVSKYRREKLRYLRGEPKKVFLQIILVGDAIVEKSSVFEINIENLSCQRIYLDEQRQVYIICQMITKHGSKHLIIRSPMQVTNNLQIPLEIQLLQNHKSPVQKYNEVSSFDDNKNLFESNDNRSFDLIIQPEQSIIIPLKACGFQQIRMRPMLSQEKFIRKEQTLFEWTQVVEMSLLQDEREIFEKKPVVLSSKILNANLVQRKNDQLFFILNANVYSIRSFIDFNTQQTDFISLKYLQISPPFTIQNLLPVALTLVFKNVIRDNQSCLNGFGKNKYTKDKQHYMLETKMNSSNQTLFLNPLGNFDMSLCIPGFDNSTFVQLKNQDEDDYKLTEQIEQENYIRSMFEDNGEQDVQQQNQSANQSIGHNKFRFLKQKKMLFQLTSQFQNQFNVCANFAFVQGFYHISFYSKYWFLNNTQMPIQVQMTTENFAFDRYDLPYENLDFDFDSITKFKKNDLDSGQQEEFDKDGNQKAARKNSLDSFQTETVKDGKSHMKYSSIKSHMNKNDLDINYRELQDVLSKSNPYGHSRLRPWESYKISDDLNSGLIAALSNEDINKVSTIYMAQEILNEEEEEEKEEIKNQKRINNKIADQSKLSKKSVRFLAQNNTLVDDVTQEEIKQEFEKYQMKQERQTMISKTSIQYINYHDFLQEKNVLNLNYLQVSKPNLFETPLSDKDQLKRVILFSDSPVEDQLYENQQIRIKISDSLWSNILFDINKLQGQSISIQDKKRFDQKQSLFEIVSQVQYLPYPFSFSKMLTFNPKYTFINKTYQTLYVIQSECEENGIFKIYPQETSIFHWTDSQKKYHVSIKLEEYEYSGNFQIDQIGEFNMRLKSTFDSDCIILNVLINEENNQFFIVVGDVSYAPPYRIENLTKTTFKVAQQDSRSDDFDIIKPFGIISFAWSYPLGNKLLAISICSQSQDTYLGPYNIDHIKKNEQIILKDKKNNRDFILEIINEKTIKCVRIMNAANASTHTELIKNQEEKQQKDSTQKIKVVIKSLGMSIVNSQAREIAYISVDNFKFTKQQTNKNKKISIKCDVIQIDNQLVRQNDAIILKKQMAADSRQFVLKMNTLDNQAIENLYYYKYFFLELAPFDLNLDGNFCDEFYKYLLDIFTDAKRFSSQQESFPSTLADKNPYDELEDLEQMKQTFNDLKKPYEKKDSFAQKKVFFEQFFINDIKLNFTFQSSPMLFREFTMNPTLKFFIVLLSNLKNVQLKFSQYRLAHQHLLLPIFISQIKKHYIYQCYSHQQFLEIVTSMGLFGNLSETASSLQYAFKSLFQNPMRVGIKQSLKGGVIFLKHTLTAFVSPVGSILDSFRRGLYFLMSSQNPANPELNDLTMDRELFEDDINQANRELNSISSPLALIDTQNRIWMKIISREKQNYEVKKQQLKRYKELNQNDYAMDTYKGSNNRGGNLTQLFKQSQSNHHNQRHQQSLIFKGLSYAIYGALFLPRTLWSGSVNAARWVNYQISEEQQQTRVFKKRPPRFVNFRMELESYNEQKALAFQILNDINLNVLETETIQKVFTMKYNSFILTGKRFICVTSQKQRGVSQKFYSHWNILFKDIIRFQLRIFDYNSKEYIGEKKFMEMINQEEENRHALRGVFFMMLVYYHLVGDSGETGEIDQGSLTTSDNLSGQLDSQSYHISERNRRNGKGSSMLGNVNDITNGIGLDMLGDLRIEVKKIVATYREHKKIKVLYSELNKEIGRINYIR